MVRKINDPIFGLIELNQVESRIIDSPLFQRLRYINQLGLAHYVYPTATHSRFTHSLGVFFLTDVISNVLKKQNTDLFDEESVNNLKMAALLHDIGHFPFSHSLEFYGKREDFLLKDLPFFFKLSHEKFGAYIIRNSYIKEILEENGYDFEQICNLIEGNDLENIILNRIINWELDADRLDYILRDSFFTGVGFGNVNYQYLLNNFRVYKNTRIVIDTKAIRDIEHFIISRFSLHDRVYTHKTSSYFTYMLTLTAHQVIKDFDFPKFSDKKSLNQILANEENSQELYELTDFALLNKFREVQKKIKPTSEKNFLLRGIDSIFYRKKLYSIKKYAIFTSKSEYETDLLKYRIQNILNDLIEQNPNDIFVHTPKNVFTSYMKIKVPPVKLTQNNDEKFNGEEERTIWIQEKNNPPEIFYKSNETFFEKIHEFGITKILIYINKNNKKLIKEYKKREPEVKEILEES
ncbi:MAG: HD domain-containing protein [Candidatus Lokiarchaeota archaeon]